MEPEDAEGIGQKQRYCYKKDSQTEPPVCVLFLWQEVGDCNVTNVVTDE